MKGHPKSKLHAFQKHINAEGGVCARCQNHRDYLTVDHIIPLGIVLLLLPKDETQNDDWNFQALCRPCNQLKGARLDFSDPRTLVNLRRYIDKAEAYYNETDL